WFTAADVHVEHLHSFELVDDALGFGCRQLSGITATGTRQAVSARQVARIGEFPGQADRGIESMGEVIDKRCAHAERSRNMFVSTRVESARAYGPNSSAAMPTPLHAARAVGAAPSACTTSSRRRSFRKDSRRVPKW